MKGIALVKIRKYILMFSLLLFLCMLYSSHASAETRTTTSVNWTQGQPAYWVGSLEDKVVYATMADERASEPIDTNELVTVQTLTPYSQDYWSEANIWDHGATIEQNTADARYLRIFRTEFFDKPSYISYRFTFADRPDIVLETPVEAGQVWMVIIIDKDTKTIVFRVDHTTSFRLIMEEVVVWGSSYNFQRMDLYSGELATESKAPEPVTVPDLREEKGNPVTSWTEGIQFRWYWSDLFIPTRGEIKDMDVSGNPETDTRLSTDGITFDRIGSVIHNYEIRDEHSLNTTDPLYADDQTVATAERKITVTTNQVPQLRMTYAAGAKQTDGTSIPPNTQYIASGNTASGGEDGWTNQAIDIEVDPHTIQGNFDTVLSIQDEEDRITTNGIATTTNYHTQSPTNVGADVRGILTEVGLTTNKLSPAIRMMIKIDTTLPTPDIEHVDGMVFNDASTDDLSGISTIKNPTKIAFSQAGGTQPADEDFHELNSLPLITSGRYDVWVWATDLAGNEKIEMKLPNFSVLGEVVIAKNSTEGATLHIATCDNHESSERKEGCKEGCVEGKGIRILEQSEITYELALTNKDTDKEASGTFEDYLPKGVTYTGYEAQPEDSITNVQVSLPEVSGEHEGQIKVTGEYTIDKDSRTIVSLIGETPAFDTEVGASNVISNQASITWTIDGVSDVNVSNYANHEIAKVRRATTAFTKVGANDLSTGIAGAEFVLYAWKGEGAADGKIVNRGELVDGDWVRVKFNGETATALSDIFVSSAAAGKEGLVDLGNLPDGEYTLIETKAPPASGTKPYELPAGQWALTIDSNKDDTALGGYKINFTGKRAGVMPPAAIRESKNGEIVYKIVNEHPFMLPLSGLGGTRIFTIVGIILMLIAGVSYTIRRRKK